MASHFKWYPSSEEVIVPWNARYSYPSQANKAVKMTPRIPPKAGSNFLPGQVIRLEFPAQGYVNPMNTTLEFDVLLKPTSLRGNLRIQNNIQSLFSRVRLLYGATPIEDVINYNVIVRCLTEWTGTCQSGTMDQSSIAEGIGGVHTSEFLTKKGLVNTRQVGIQGSVKYVTAPGGTDIVEASIPNSQIRRRYQVSFALGMFTQDKLIPTKFMASQLAIEITLANADSCLIFRPFAGPLPTTNLPNTYEVQNVNLIPEILEFDASYDMMFLKGLREGGVPIKFASW